MITNQGFISLFGISLKAAFGLPHLVSLLFGPLISGVSETFFFIEFVTRRVSAASMVSFQWVYPGHTFSLTDQS